MSFMKPEITEREDWIVIDGYSTDEKTIPQECFSFSDLDENKCYEIEKRKGFGARLSAPGYLDCTDWTIHDTKQEAAEYLLETYYEDMPFEEYDEEDQAIILELAREKNAQTL